MAEHSRYDVPGEEGVLKNKLNIKDSEVLEDVETLLFSDTYVHFFNQFDEGKLCFDLELIFEIHEYFLKALYSWAGKIRTVEISRDGVLFAASAQIDKSLREFKKILDKNIPTPKDTKKTVADKLAVIHCELNAIHPFREGNGRTIRLFLDLLAVNCGFEVIDFGKTKKKDYIDACIAGMKKDYSKTGNIIYKGLRKRK